MTQNKTIPDQDLRKEDYLQPGEESSLDDPWIHKGKRSQFSPQCCNICGKPVTPLNRHGTCRPCEKVYRENKAKTLKNVTPKPISLELMPPKQ